MIDIIFGTLFVIFCVAWLVNLAVKLPQAHIRALRFTCISGAVLVALGALYVLIGLL